VKVFVSGATGFIGQKVVARLLDAGHDVIASGSASRQSTAAIDWLNQVDYRSWNIDSNQAVALLLSVIPDVLIHCAWSHLDDYHSAAHLDRLLPAHYRFISEFVAAGVRQVTVLGTCMEYGLQEGELTETMEAQPQLPYAAAKNRLRQQLQLLQSQTPFTLQWLRLFYVYGEGQRSNTLLGQLEAALARGDPRFDMSAGDQQRDYLEVHALARQICAVVENRDFDGIVNCCSGKPITVLGLVQRHLLQRNQHIKLNRGVYPYSAHEAKHFWGSVEKLHAVIGANV
jgi:dTDP-6-deoxy-L-talose 4-dehydrogenase (NAD+)